jgi:Bacteriocin-protection, YdeI or OmpD-Associated/Domain of unknown function (DUF1905)
MRFKTKIIQSGKTATGIQVPAKVVESLGTSKKPAVSVTIKGYTYRSTIAVMGGKFMVGVSAKVREASGVAGGDTVDVDIELDTAPRVLEVPADLKEALGREKEAKEIFDGLSYSRKQRLVLPIEDAKTPETRQRRVDKAISILREGKA